MCNKWILGILLVLASSFGLAKEVVTDAPNTVTIEENDMSQARLEQLFKSSFYKTKTVSNGDLIIQFSNGGNALVKIDSGRKLLRYYKVYGFKEKGMKANKIELANRVNGDVIFVRASVPLEDPDSLLLDYFLSYEGGISAFQVVSTLRYFSEVAGNAIIEQDTGNIIE